ncbi:ornithine cyclodeaminase/mu-crystallin family protein [Halopolyspora algeriensis]|uniref:Ornithine cyclodeaminase/mu-crystallin family protein n=1 Tax=Halopolyspora algeriensis TaxID=1500506 RepID=A0A368VHJ7_9ACTN|nr:ornithine cyclodeaminase/mu-crystallin family protein [Halopolyspora algeriensis]
MWAISAVRSPEVVRVYSRDERNRKAFAVKVHDRLGIRAEPVATAASAVRGADIVVMATRSTAPVIDPADVAPGAHVTTVGPKGSTTHELPPTLLEAAGVVACDSPPQAAAMPDFVTDPAGVVSLGDIVIGAHPGREDAKQITVYCSVGLAGSEVLLAGRLLGEGAGGGA